MTKGEFFMVLNECFQHSSVTEINKTLRGIKFLRWCVEYLNRVNEGYVECKNCDEFVRIEECEIEEHEENHLLGPKLKREYICPICGEAAAEVDKRRGKPYKAEDTKEKEEFFQFLDKFFEHKRVTEINETLRKLPFYDWRDEYLKKRNVGYLQCQACKQYVQRSECQSRFYTVNALIDNREVFEIVCPLCGQIAFKSSTWA